MFMLNTLKKNKIKPWRKIAALAKSGQTPLHINHES